MCEEKFYVEGFEKLKAAFDEYEIRREIQTFRLSQIIKVNLSILT